VEGAAGQQTNSSPSTLQQPLTPWQQYAQVLLSCSEFMHIE
jgi:hypothetical protein